MYSPAQYNALQMVYLPVKSYARKNHQNRTYSSHKKDDLNHQTSAKRCADTFVNAEVHPNAHTYAFTFKLF